MEPQINQAVNTTTQPVPQPEPVSVPPAPSGGSESQSMPTDGSSRKWLLLALVTVLIIVVVAVGGYWYMMNKETLTGQDNSLTNETKNGVKGLDSELKSIKEIDIESEFSEVDQDLQSL